MIGEAGTGKGDGGVDMKPPRGDGSGCSLGDSSGRIRVGGVPPPQPFPGRGLFSRFPVDAGGDGSGSARTGVEWGAYRGEGYT